VPKKVSEVKNIVQIYCGHYSSFAVDKIGDIKAWGLNRNNYLLTNQPQSNNQGPDDGEHDSNKTIVTKPKLVNLPDYFMKHNKNNRLNVVQNANHGYDIYSSEKPVKSNSSRTQEELERVREENIKLRKKVKDYQNKF